MGRYNSFIVRVWTDGDGRLRGKIEHVITRESLTFSELEPIVGFIRGRLWCTPDFAVIPDDGQPVDVAGPSELPSGRTILFERADDDSNSFDEKPPV